MFALLSEYNEIDNECIFAQRIIILVEFGQHFSGFHSKKIYVLQKSFNNSIVCNLVLYALEWLRALKRFLVKWNRLTIFAIKRLWIDNIWVFQTFRLMRFEHKFEMDVYFGISWESMTFGEFHSEFPSTQSILSMLSGWKCVWNASAHMGEMSEF